MTDDMMRALGKNGGVIMINYHAGFLGEEFRVASEKRSGNIVQQMAEMSKKCGGNDACTTMEDDRMDHEAMMNGQLPKVFWEKIVDHIDHAVKIAGADHVGLGSDFDGATMPLGMEDVTKLPKITDALLKKGYSDRDVEKILGGNFAPCDGGGGKGSGEIAESRMSTQHTIREWRCELHRIQCERMIRCRARRRRRGPIRAIDLVVLESAAEDTGDVARVRNSRYARTAHAEGLILRDVTGECLAPTTDAVRRAEAELVVMNTPM